MTSIPELERELSRLSRDPYGSARSSAVEQIVRRVEVEGPAEVLAYAYSTLVDSYVWGGEVEKVFVPFTRWVRWFDERPELFDDHDRYALFWSFKWMVSHCSDFPQIPFGQIEATLADMERRYALAGHGMNGVRLEQFRWARARRAPETPELFHRWTTTPRDEFANCEACDPSEQAVYLAANGRTDEAARLIERTLEGDPTCGTEPADMLSQLAECYLDLGRPAEAVSAYRRAVKDLEVSVGAMASTRGRLVLTLARGGQGERAVRRVEAEQNLLHRAETPLSRLNYLTAVAGAMRVVARTQPDLPVGLAEAATVSELATWATQQATELAAAFDARNRSDGMARALAEALALEPAAEPLDLTVLPTSPAAGPGSSPEPAAPRDTPEASGASLVEQADRLVRRGELAEAAALYHEAVGAFREAGALLDAGLAEANAARCAHELEDVEGADAAYRHAIGVLRAAEAPVTLVSTVTRSWVPLALEAGSTAEALGLLVELRDALDAALAAEETPALRTELAESLDTHARALAAAGEHEAAVRVASDAAERFAALGRIADAAHSFWLAGKALVAAGRDDDAVFHLESAVEGFSRAHEPTLRGHAATDLVDALRRLGRDAEAADAARGLEL